MTKIYYDRDADISVLSEKTIGIIGYGNQGRAQALNMRDSGLRNIMIHTADDETRKRAENDNFAVLSLSDLAKKSDILFFLVPDEILPDLFRDQVRPLLRPGQVLNFASGYNITFKLIVAPEETDVIMVAPRMIGDGVRNLFEQGKGYPAFIAIEQDTSGKARSTALALAKAMGATRMGTIEVTFRDETMLDLLAEQAIWPMILAVLTESFRFEVDKGHPVEASLVELYISRESAYMFEKMAEKGMFKQMPFHSHTSQYGQLSRLESLDKSFIRETLSQAYEHIDSGNFAREWKREQEMGMPEFNRLLTDAFQSDVTRAEEKMNLE